MAEVFKLNTFPNHFEISEALPVSKQNQISCTQVEMLKEM